MIYTLLAYGFVWLLIFGYIVFIHKRQSKLEKQLAVLKELVDMEEFGGRPAN